MRTWRLPADVDTDQLAPGHTMKHGLEVTARHCLEAVRPDFAAGVRRGDAVVAGPNFGIGSSREQAASVLVALGVAAVIAPSFAGLFFRNAFNVGLLLLTCPQADRIPDGAAIAFDARAGWIELPPAASAGDGRGDNGDGRSPGDRGAFGRRLPVDPIPAFLLDLVDAGGLLAHLKRTTGATR